MKGFITPPIREQFPMGFRVQKPLMTSFSIEDDGDVPSSLLRLVRTCPENEMTLCSTFPFLHRISLPHSHAEPTADLFKYKVAGSIDDITSAWELTYTMYFQKGLIHANPYRIHTVPQAIQHSTTVIGGWMGERIMSTLSVYVDGAMQLPLDAVYRDRLSILRKGHFQLYELGLFADRRNQLARSIDSILEMMRYGTYFCIRNNHIKPTLAVIGVHPQHVPFYTRVLGFEVMGPQREYSTVRDNPVVLLGLNWNKAMNSEKKPRGLRYISQFPVDAGSFACPYAFPTDEIRNSRIGLFLQQFGQSREFEAMAS